MTSMVALSGWAMPASVFKPLQAFYDMRLLGLPGSESWPGITKASDLTWKTLVAALGEILPDEPITLMGWSLGGSLAIQYAALFPERVKRLVLMGCNPCFVARDDWPCALSPALFQQFISGMQTASEATLKKFMFLCVQGAQNARQLMRELRRLVAVEKPMDTSLLTSLLMLLGDDLRLVLHQVTCPVTHILFEQDALVPCRVGEKIAHDYPAHRIVMSEGSHTFFREDVQIMAQRLIEHSDSK